MPEDDSLFLELHDLIIRAATRATPWQSFIERLGEITGHRLGIFYHEHFAEGQTRLSDIVHGESRLTQQYLHYYQHLNPYLRRCDLRRVPAGYCELLDNLIARSEVERTEFYQDFVRPQNLTLDDAMFTIVYNDGHVLSSIALCRAQEQTGLPAGESLALLARIAPHLRTAFELYTRMAGWSLDWQSCRSALDHLPFGVILLNHKGQPCVVNDVARDISDARDGVQISDEGLRAMDARDTSRLRRMLQKTAQAALGHGHGPGGVLRLPRPSLRPAYEVLMTALPSSDASAWPGHPAVAVFLMDPSAERAPMADVLQALYELSPAQARVVTLLSAGKTLAAIAEELQITRETARAHLKGAFLKTGTSRQSELVRLAVSSPAALRRPGMRS